MILRFWPRHLQQISKHRAFLYGVAALWVMFFHFFTRIPPMGVLTPLRYIQDHGNGGVDIFVLLSGFGLYHSMKNSASVGEFYKKRLLRVFLPSFIVVAFYNVLVDESFVAYLANTTFLGYWFGYFAIWYIAFILTMYALYPIIYRLQYKQPNSLYILLAGSVVLTYACEYFHIEQNVLRGVCRIPAFLAGCIFAPMLVKKAKIPRWVFPAALAAAVMMLLFENTDWAESFYYFYHSFLYFFTSVSIVLATTFLAEWILQHKCIHGIYRFFAFCGMLSLEFYLLFERCRFVLLYLPGFESDPYSFIKVDLATIICTFVLSVVLHWLTQLLISTYESVRIPLPEKEDAVP